MAQNLQTNTFLGGMDRDSNDYLIKDSSYRYAKDIRVIADNNGETGYIQPRDHIREYNSVLEGSEQILGVTSAEIDRNNKVINCAVVLTRYRDKNRLNLITGFEDGTLSNEIFIEYDLDIKSDVTILSNRESSTVCNVYISDGTTEIKVININGDKPDIYDSSQFDLTPKCNLAQPKFVEYCDGILPAGKIQYAFLLFHKNGTETTLSPCSQIIPIVEYANTSDKVYGLEKEEVSNNGCIISIQILEDNKYFDYIRIYRIVYSDDTSTPTIQIASEQRLTSTNTITYSDSGKTVLSTISIEEFSNIINNSFSANILEKHTTRLYAASLKDLTFDLSEDNFYDTRAFRCNPSKQVVLKDEVKDDIVGTMTSSGTISGYDTIDKEHDCINPSTEEIGNYADGEYEYGVDNNGNLFLGGRGPNISFQFVLSEIVISDEQTTNGRPADNLKLSANKKTGTSYYRYLNGSTVTHTVLNGDRIPNYSDPYTCVNCTGYQRDEVYPFGIVFYNKKGQRSPVHWIADIKMPKSWKKYPSNIVNGEYINTFKQGAYSNDYKTTYDLLGYALGLEFTVNNLPEEVYAYEIVRCDRTRLDRTVLTQGVLSNTFNARFRFGTDAGDNTIVPSPWLYSQKKNDWLFLPDGEKEEDFFLYMKAWIMQHKGSNELSPYIKNPYIYELICPEASFAYKDSVDYLLDSTIQPIQYKASYSGYKSSDIPASIQTGQNYRSEGYTLGYWMPITSYQAINSGDTKVNSAMNFAVCSKDWARIHGQGVIGPWFAEYDWAGVAAMKYYYTKPFTLQNKHYKIKDCIATDVGWLQPGVEVNSAMISSFSQGIDAYRYLNVSFRAPDHKDYGPHGKSLVVALDKTDNTSVPVCQIIDYIQTPEDYSDPFGKCNTVCTVNAYNTKANPYGGNTYTARQSRVYISTGAYNTRDNTKCICYGGDTYLSVFEHLTTYTKMVSNDPLQDWGRNATIVSYIPLESTYNLALRTDATFSKLVQENPKTAWLIEDNPVAHSNFVQEKPLYLYNDVYSADPTAQPYVEKDQYSETNAEYPNRVTASEAKTQGEIIDSWSKFKFANYIDIDFDYGKLTNLESFGDKLYFWTDSSLGVLSINDRSLITDETGAQLVLGTGGVLQRYDRIVLKNGSSIINDKSIVTSDTTLYWYDSDKNEMCAYGNGFNILSKQKSIQSDLNELTKEQIDDIQSNRISTSLYDKKYNEVWIKVYEKPVIYNENLQAFTAYYSKEFDNHVSFSEQEVLISGVRLFYIHDQYHNDQRDPINRQPELKVVINKDAQITKAFDNVWFTGDINSKDVITKVQFETKTQVSNSIDQSNIENREDTYRFPIPREDASSEQCKESKSFLGRMRGKYLISNYNFDCNDDKVFKIPYLTTTYRHSRL